MGFFSDVKTDRISGKVDGVMFTLYWTYKYVMIPEDENSLS